MHCIKSCTPSESHPAFCILSLCLYFVCVLCLFVFVYCVSLCKTLHCKKLLRAKWVSSCIWAWRPTRQAFSKGVNQPTVMMYVAPLSPYSSSSYPPMSSLFESYILEVSIKLWHIFPVACSCKCPFQPQGKFLAALLFAAWKLFMLRNLQFFSSKSYFWFDLDKMGWEICRKFDLVSLKSL